MNFFFISSPRISSSCFYLLLILLSVRSSRIEQHLKSPGDEKAGESRSCDFGVDRERRDRSVAEFLRCTDYIAENPLPPESRNFPAQLDAVFENFRKSFSRSSARQGYGFPREEGLYRPGRPIPGGGFYGNEAFPEYPGPPGDFASGLVEALDSISQYDDLRCVPRLLCEIATGSRPGLGEYKASNLQGFGKDTLIGLLSAYNFEEASSPVLAFGKAALLGYTSKGDSSVCYDEYADCPRDPRDLVHYLNNHNGGFFRFFRNARGKPVPEGSKRVGFSVKAPAPPPGLSGPESDRTGTGELKFDAPASSARYDGGKISSSRLNGEDFSRVVFPDDEGVTNGGGSSRGFFPPPSNGVSAENVEAPSFFPSDYEDSEKSNVVFQSGEDFGDGNYKPYFRKGRLLALVQPNDETSGFRFPGPEERGIFDSGVSRLFPSN